MKACQVAAQKGRILKLREVAKIGTEMSYDYAFGFFIASFSAGVVIGAGNPSTGETFINEVDPTLNAKIDEILEGNIKTDPHPEMSNAKRRDLAALTAYLNAL